MQMRHMSRGRQLCAEQDDITETESLCNTSDLGLGVESQDLVNDYGNRFLLQAMSSWT